MHPIGEPQIQSPRENAKLRWRPSRSAAAAGARSELGARRRKNVRELQLVLRHLGGGAEGGPLAVDPELEPAQVARLPEIEATDFQIAGDPFVVDDEDR